MVYSLLGYLISGIYMLKIGYKVLRLHGILV